VVGITDKANILPHSINSVLRGILGRHIMKPNYFSELASCYVIAEIGVNHNGDLELAKEMIIAAKDAGADAVKFQTFTADTLVTKGTPKVGYQESTTSPSESHYEMIKRLELGRPQHIVLFDFCASVGLDFISTPYDLDSARFLNGIGVKMFKTASADLVDLPLQEYLASTGKPVLVATGMSSLGEVEQVVNIYDELNNPDLLLLHCVSNYPCMDVSLNLRAMKTLSSAFDKPVGYSDHSVGSLAAALSVGLGAKVIEKHFTLDKNMPGPDHKASSTPEEFRELVQQIRRAEVILGSPKKSRQPEESQMASVSRKSLVFTRSMKAGDIVKTDDMRLMRPGTGIGAGFIGTIVGKRVNKNLEEMRMVRWSDFEED
jgi:N,N'-diacetyllegionaminate synthase